MTEGISPNPPRVALLVDGDNLSHLHAGALILASAKLGKLIVKRVHGDMTKHPGWDNAPGFRVLHSGSGKNASDLALTVDAMALMLDGQADVLALASSDGDFSHLALHLVERGMTVLGLGEAKAPEHFRKACSSFHQLAGAKPAAAKTPPPSTPAAPPKPTPAQTSALAPEELVAKVCRRLEAEPQGLQINRLSEVMKSQHGVQIGKTPHKTWRAFLLAHPDRFGCDPRGPEARVWLLTDPLLIKTSDLLATETQGLPIALLSTRMNKEHGVQIGKTHHKNWRAFLRAHPDRFDCDPPGPEARVRLSSPGPAAPPTLSPLPLPPSSPKPEP